MEGVFAKPSWVCLKSIKLGRDGGEGGRGGGLPAKCSWVCLKSVLAWISRALWLSS